jgi:hypothetical protein
MAPADAGYMAEALFFVSEKASKVAGASVCFILNAACIAGWSFHTQDSISLIAAEESLFYTGNRTHTLL